MNVDAHTEIHLGTPLGSHNSTFITLNIIFCNIT